MVFRYIHTSFNITYSDVSSDPSTQSEGQEDGYYAALVAVAIIAAIACVGFLGLLVILLRKQSHAKAHINSSRNNAAYDNPSYKVGDNVSMPTNSAFVLTFS